MYRLFALLCLAWGFIISLAACSYLQKTGALNDRADDYKHAKIYKNPLVDNPVWPFANSYPIPDIPAKSQITNAATPPDTLLRPTLGFIATEGDHTDVAYLLTYQKQQSRTVYLGTTVMGETALLLQDATDKKLHDLLAQPALGVRAEKQNFWHATTQPISIQAYPFVTATMLVFRLDGGTAATSDENAFVDKKQQNPEVVHFATVFRTQLLKLLR